MQSPPDVNDGREWSERDLSDLRRELLLHGSVAEAAVLLRRSGTVDDVRRKCTQLGLVPAARNGARRADYAVAQSERRQAQHMKTWSDDDVARLRDMAARCTTAEIARSLGRTQAAVSTRAAQLGVRLSSSPRAG